MEVLEYWDDVKIAKKVYGNSYFIPLILFIISSVSLVFFGTKIEYLDSIKDPSIIDITLLICCVFIVLINISSFIIHLYFIFFGSYKEILKNSKSHLLKQKEKYIKERNIKLLDRNIFLDKNKFNFSIFENGEGYISKEIMCSDFFVDKKGRAYIQENSEYCLKSDVLSVVYYHHIIDNRDNHIISSKELLEKYFKEATHEVKEKL